MKLEEQKKTQLQQQKLMKHIEHIHTEIWKLIRWNECISFSFFFCSPVLLFVFARLLCSLSHSLIRPFALCTHCDFYPFSRVSIHICARDVLQTVFSSSLLFFASTCLNELSPQIIISIVVCMKWCEELKRNVKYIARWKGNVINKCIWTHTHTHLHILKQWKC